MKAFPLRFLRILVYAPPVAGLSGVVSFLAAVAVQCISGTLSWSLANSSLVWFLAQIAGSPRSRTLFECSCRCVEEKYDALLVRCRCQRGKSRHIWA